VPQTAPDQLPPEAKVAEQQRAHESRVEAAKAVRAAWKKDLEKLAEGKWSHLTNTVARSPQSR
jgi:hypothetical protein